MASIRFFLFFCMISLTLSHPAFEELKNVVPEIILSIQSNNATNSTSKYRQDEGVDGIGEAVELTAVGENVGNIVTGLFGGNFDTIFKGVGGFITEEDTAAGVGTIFQSLSTPLTQVFQTGIQAGQKYFGFGNATSTVRPGTIVGQAGVPGATPVYPAAVTATGGVLPVGTVGTGTVPVQGAAVPVVQPVVAQPVVTAAPVVSQPVPTTDEDEDSEDPDGDVEAKF